MKKSKVADSVHASRKNDETAFFLSQKVRVQSYGLVPNISVALTYEIYVIVPHILHIIKN